MHPVLHNITIDCTGDPYDLGRFWSEVLGRPLHDDDKPGDPAAIIEGSDEYPNLLFIQVPDVKAVKNRLHFDLRPVGRTREQEVERLLGIGATLFDDQRRPDGSGWIVLADPEGNEFCVERSNEERAAADQAAQG